MLDFICRRHIKKFVNVQGIKLLFYALVKYVDLIENALRKITKYLYFKEFGCYNPRHCDQKSLLSVPDERTLIGRSTSSLIFVQNNISGQIASQALFGDVNIGAPR